MLRLNSFLLFPGLAGIMWILPPCAAAAAPEAATFRQGVTLTHMRTAAAQPHSRRKRHSPAASCGPYRDQGVASRFCNKQPRQGKRRFKTGEHVVSQISPRASRTGTYALLCNGKKNRHPACPKRAPEQLGLPEALLEAPSRRNAATLKQLGIPAIKDVPPIAILRSHRDEDEHFRRHRR